MKKLPLAFAALVAVAGIAKAQSSVTMYGVADDGFVVNTNSGGKHLYALTSSGAIQNSRWGLRGEEDLGGGVKAIFKLENGFDINTGKLSQGGLEFGRNAFVGVQSPYGTVTLGRQYDSVVDYIGEFEVGDQWGGAFTAHTGDIDNVNNSFRTNNSVKYASPSYAGITFQGMYSFGGVAGSAGRDQVFSFGIGYKSGPLAMGAAYLNVRNPNVSFFGNSNQNAISSNVSNLSSPVTSGYGSANTYQVIGGGAAYTFGAATIGGTYTNTKFYNLGSSYASPFAGQTGAFNNAEVNFKYQLTPAFLVGTAYDYTRASEIAGTSAAQYHQASLGFDYFLSKRTDAYVIGVYQRASGTTLSATGTTPVPAVAAITGLTASTNQNQFAARVGIRTRF